MPFDPLRRRRRLLLTGLTVLVVLFGGIVFFKSVLLKPFNILFKKKHAGAVVPVHLIGTYQDPHAGLDLPVKASPDKPPAVSK